MAKDNPTPKQHNAKFKDASGFVLDTHTAIVGNGNAQSNKLDAHMLGQAFKPNPSGVGVGTVKMDKHSLRTHCMRYKSG